MTYSKTIEERLSIFFMTLYEQHCYLFFLIKNTKLAKMVYLIIIIKSSRTLTGRNGPWILQKKKKKRKERDLLVYWLDNKLNTESSHAEVSLYTLFWIYIDTSLYPTRYYLCCKQTVPIDKRFIFFKCIALESCTTDEKLKGRILEKYSWKRQVSLLQCLNAVATSHISVQ